MDRRRFLKLGGGALSGALLPIGCSAWAANAAQAGPRLVVVLLRGAVDGLNVVVPYTEDAYYDYRPTIAIARAGSDEGVVDLDGRFGLNPALGALMPLWKSKQLAFVHACGSPDPDRSHFEAQAYMESGTPGVPETTTGWMNRAAAELHFRRATETVAFGSTVPLIVRGPVAVATFPSGRGATHSQPVDRDRIRHLFDPLYQADPRLSAMWQEAEATRQKLLSDLSQDMLGSAQGAAAPQAFAGDATRAARMMVADPTLRLVFFQLGGWDTHVNQGAARGQLADRLQQLATGLQALQQSLGPAWNETVVLVISEFGRTARENGNRGTDHGHGNVHWVLGGNIGGGRVYGDWPGLAPDALHQDRDLQVTTDFRSLISVVLERHMKLVPEACDRVLPAFKPAFQNIAGLIPA